MDNLIKDMRENLNSYSFKVVSDLVKELEVNRDNKAQIKELADLLKEDKRKNLSSNLNSIFRQKKSYLKFSSDSSFSLWREYVGIEPTHDGISTITRF